MGRAILSLELLLEQVEELAAANAANEHKLRAAVNRGVARSGRSATGGRPRTEEDEAEMLNALGEGWMLRALTASRPTNEQAAVRERWSGAPQPLTRAAALKFIAALYGEPRPHPDTVERRIKAAEKWAAVRKQKRLSAELVELLRVCRRDAPNLRWSDDFPVGIPAL